MEKTNEATPKWQILDQGHTEEIIEDVGEGVQYILAFIKFTGDGILQEKNRQRLLKAVNAYDSLVAMQRSLDSWFEELQKEKAENQKLREAVEYLISVNYDDNEVGRPNKILTEIKALLTKAKNV